MAVTTTPHTGGESSTTADAQGRRIGGGLLDPKMLWRSLPDAFKKLDPRVQLRNPVMFVVEVGALVTLYTAIKSPSIFNPGPHGLTEVLYAFTSMANNNGSAFAGLGTAATWYQVTGGIVMLLGRFAPEIFILGLAGSLARQAPTPASAGTLDTRTPLFVGMLVGVILILVGLTYFPALALGVFAEGLHCGPFSTG